MASWSARYRWAFLAAVTVTGLLLDFATKVAAVKYLPSHVPVRIAGDYFSLVLVYNKAALFGIDPRRFLPGFPLNTFFFAFSGVAVVALVFYFRRIKHEESSVRWGLACIMPGALGNLSDRVFHPDQGVVDFIKLGISPYVYWPVFNLADVYITVGVGLILLSVVIDERTRRAAQRASVAAPAAPPPDSSAGA